MIRKLNSILILLIMCGFSIWLWLSICWESLRWIDSASPEGDSTPQGFMKSGQQTVLNGHTKRVSCCLARGWIREMSSHVKFGHFFSPRFNDPSTRAALRCVWWFCEMLADEPAHHDLRVSLGQETWNAKKHFQLLWWPGPSPTSICPNLISVETSWRFHGRG